MGDLRLACSKCAAELKCYACQSPKAVGTKAVDLLALSPSNDAWLIEIKDYRQHQRTKAIELADEVAIKTRDSLAALAAARLRANDAEELNLAQAALKSPNLRIVLHLEQPKKHSKLFPRAINPANVRARLTQLIKAIDPHPQVLDRHRLQGVPWTAN